MSKEKDYNIDDNKKLDDNEKKGEIIVQESNVEEASKNLSPDDFEKIKQEQKQEDLESSKDRKRREKIEKKLAKRRGFRGFLRRIRQLILFILIVAIVSFAYYLYNSDVVIKDHSPYDKQKIIDEAKANRFDGLNIKLSLTESDINNYINSEFSDYLSRVNLPFGMKIKAFKYVSDERNLYFNVYNKYINTSLIQEVEPSWTDDGKIYLIPSKMKLGKYLLPLPTDFIIKQYDYDVIFEEGAKVPEIFDVDEIELTDDGIDISLKFKDKVKKDIFSFNENSFENDIIEKVEKFSIYNVVNEETIKDIKTIKEKKLTTFTDNMIAKVASKGAYLEDIFVLLKEDRAKKFASALREFTPEYIDADLVDKAYTSRKAKIESLKEEIATSEKKEVIQEVTSYINPFIDIVNGYLEKNDSRIVAWNGYPYLRASKKVLTYDLIKRYNFDNQDKALNPIPKDVDIDIFARGNEIMVGTNSSVGYLLFVDKDKYEEYADRELAKEKYGVTTIPATVKNFNRYDPTLLSAVENAVKVKLSIDTPIIIRHIELEGDWAYMIFSIKDDQQAIKQAILKKDENTWLVSQMFGATDYIYLNIRPDILAAGFPLYILADYEVADYKINQVTGEEVLKLLNDNRKPKTETNIISLEEISYMSRVDNVLVAITGKYKAILIFDDEEQVLTASYIPLTREFRDYYYLLDYYELAPYFIFPY